MDNFEINQEDEQIKQQSPSLSANKSADVYNALNLYNESLGALYEEEGYNPFDEDFKLTEEFADDVLKNRLSEKDIFIEQFLDKSNKEIAQHFNNALNNSTQLLKQLEDSLKNTTDPQLKEQVKKSILVIKNRNQLLKHNIKTLKQKGANAVKMYKEMFEMDFDLNSLLTETFNEKANIQIVLNNILDMCLNRSVNLKTKIAELKQSQVLRNEIINEQAVQNQLNQEEIKQEEKPVFEQPTFNQENQNTNQNELEQ